jgi:hypothetical protein
MAVQVWSNVAVAMQSALGANKTISAITKASPGVASSTSHGIADGAYVSLNNIQGMYELDGRVARIDNPVTNAFDLEGIDTTNFGTFSSGVANEITFGTSLGTGLSIAVSGGDFDFIDYTTIHDLVRKQLIGLANPTVISMDLIWDPSDAAFTALKAAADAKAIRAFRFTFANGYKWLFAGYVGFSGAPTGQAQEVVKTPLVITSNGRLSSYAT